MPFEACTFTIYIECKHTVDSVGYVIYNRYCNIMSDNHIHIYVYVDLYIQIYVYHIPTYNRRISIIIKIVPTTTV
jgi:hypothetical protein